MGEIAVMADQKRFWNKRAEDFRHTGWGNYLKYAFDQPARLKAIETVLAGTAVGNDTALDYGCGTGDFSVALSSRFRKVIAYDISDEVIRIAKSLRRSEERIEFSSDPALLESGIPDDSLDLVLSVTVLDHILDDHELLGQLELFRRKLKPGGRLVALEYSVPGKQPPSAYQRFSTSGEWESLFRRAGFDFDARFGFYHPDRRPSRSYLGYRFHPAKWFWSLFMEKEFARNHIRALAERAVARSDDLVREAGPDDWMRIMILKKARRDA